LRAYNAAKCDSGRASAPNSAPQAPSWFYGGPGQRKKEEKEGKRERKERGREGREGRELVRIEHDWRLAKSGGTPALYTYYS